MNKKKIQVIKPNEIELDKYVEMIQDVKESVESRPPDIMKLERVIFKINSPDFKYPELKKCCKKCTSSERNISLRKAIDIIKTISIYDPIEETLEKIDLIGLVYTINDASIKNKEFRRVIS